MTSFGGLPDISTLASQTEEARLRLLNLLFESSPAIHCLLLPCTEAGPFQSYNEFISACQKLFESVLDLSRDRSTQARATLHAVLGSHPRLGAKQVESAQSASEQAKLQAGDEMQMAQLAALNAEYEATFPGLRYVVFVNGRGRPEIMQDMRKRIARGDMASEEREGIQVGTGQLRPPEHAVRARCH
jgi:2-oxo-4-hydroxy-4-carboxy--5-ureidoimidazoline (OHCU) decarboxylase